MTSAPSRENRRSSVSPQRLGYSLELVNLGNRIWTASDYHNQQHCHHSEAALRKDNFPTTTVHAVFHLISPPYALPHPFIIYRHNPINLSSTVHIWALIPSTRRMKIWLVEKKEYETHFRESNLSICQPPTVYACISHHISPIKKCRMKLEFYWLVVPITEC